MNIVILEILIVLVLFVANDVFAMDTFVDKVLVQAESAATAPRALATSLSQ